MGTKTQFSDFGYTPTGDLQFVVVNRKGLICPLWLDGYAPNVCFYARLLAVYYTRVHCQMYDLVGGCLLRVEVVDERRICVEVRPSRVPAAGIHIVGKELSTGAYHPTMTSFGFTLWCRSYIVLR